MLIFNILNMRDTNLDAQMRNALLQKRFKRILEPYVQKMNEEENLALFGSASKTVVQHALVACSRFAQWNSQRKERDAEEEKKANHCNRRSVDYDYFRVFL